MQTIKNLKTELYTNFVSRQNNQNVPNNFQEIIENFIKNNPKTTLSNKDIDDIILSLREDQDNGITPGFNSVGSIDEKMNILTLSKLTKDGYTPEFDLRITELFDNYTENKDKKIKFVDERELINKAERLGQYLSYNDYIQVINQSLLPPQLKESLKASINKKENTDSEHIFSPRINMKEMAVSYSKSYELSLKLANFVKHPLLNGPTAALALITAVTLGAGPVIALASSVLPAILMVKGSVYLAEKLKNEPENNVFQQPVNNIITKLNEAKDPVDNKVNNQSVSM
jgi:hypothetical protein